jgi:hypothetical protein
MSLLSFVEDYSVLISLFIGLLSVYFLFSVGKEAEPAVATTQKPAAEPSKEAAAPAAAPASAKEAAAPAVAPASTAAAAEGGGASSSSSGASSSSKAASGELPNLLVTRPNKAGEAPTLLFLSHRPGQVDFKINPVKQAEEGWEYFDTLADPETTGNFKLAVDGSTLDLYATAPRKWVMKFVSEGGKWQCKSAEFPGTFAEPSDMKPAPSKLGAGGLPKGSINLGEQEEDVSLGAMQRAAPPPLQPRANLTRALSPTPPPHSSGIQSSWLLMRLSPTLKRIQVLLFSNFVLGRRCQPQGGECAQAHSFFTVYKVLLQQSLCKPAV